MSVDDLAVLRRAHDLFAGPPQDAVLAAAARPPAPPPHRGQLPAAYLDTAAGHRARLVAAGDVDTDLSAILDRARGDHTEAHRQTAAVLAAARSDARALPDNPIAHRELLRRRVARLRTQHAHVRTARRRARRRLAALRALRYGAYRRRAVRPNSRAGVAVRAALSRLGCPYVWGATGPDRFDCSGLVKWAYAQAGVSLDRTTYDQINDGVPVARSQVRPGDLVFPHAGHVQLAIGDNMVVEAPHAGADVRISRLGTNVAIRRPV
ncbi:MAG: C40 family peptidase [Mycobacterium sp.]|nr:C40 family peptidase [Mycobacterium sp.]